MTRCIAFVLLAALTPLIAQEGAQSEAEGMTVEEYVAQLDFQTGAIDLADGVAELNVPETFKFLDAADAQSVLEDLWGNPEDDTVLGMLFPADVDLSQDGSWGVVVTYDEDGYVEDDEAADLDYDELLQTMQQDTRDASEEREEMGYGTVELLGWAEPPHYDASTNKLYWAKDLMFDGSPDHTLNYNIRALGRKGVLVLNAVASTEQLRTVDAAMAEVIQFVNFNEGYRYSDFNPDIDEVAAYGIGALVAGKLAAKVGLLKGLMLFLAKGWKIIAIAGVALFGLIKKMLSGKLGEEEISETST